MTSYNDRIMGYRFIFGVVLVVAIALLPMAASASSPQNKGLYISPLRQELTVNAGKSQPAFFTVANLTDQTMTVSLSVRQFSVADYTYDYKLRSPEQDWIKLQTTQVQLAPNKSSKISYDVVTPDKTTPGGYYFALVASTDISGSGLPGTIQAVSLLYLTVNGNLVRTSVLQNDSIPFLVTGTEIPYQFNVKDTGNVHFSAYFYGQLEGLFGRHPQVGTSHLLMPGAVRPIGGSIPTPLLPGIYKATYGYKVDFASFVTVKTAYILFIPPWSVIALVLLIVGGRLFWRKRQKRSA